MDGSFYVYEASALFGWYDTLEEANRQAERAADQYDEDNSQFGVGA